VDDVCLLLLGNLPCENLPGETTRRRPVEKKNPPGENLLKKNPPGENPWKKTRGICTSLRLV
jgi:hypothetical protein